MTARLRMAWPRLTPSACCATQTTCAALRITRVGGAAGSSPCCCSWLTASSSSQSANSAGCSGARFLAIAHDLSARWRELARPLSGSRWGEQFRMRRPVSRPAFVGPLLIRGHQGRLARLVVTDAPHVAAFGMDLLQGALDVQRHVRIRFGQRHSDARQALPQGTRVKCEAIALWPAADADQIVIRPQLLGAPLGNAQNMPSPTQQVDLDQ